MAEVLVVVVAAAVAVVVLLSCFGTNQPCSLKSLSRRQVIRDSLQQFDSEVWVMVVLVVVQKNCLNPWLISLLPFAFVVQQALKLEAFRQRNEQIDWYDLVVPVDQR